MFSLMNSSDNNSLSRYIEVIHPRFICYKITPTKNSKNYNSDKIISTVSGLYRNIFSKIQKANSKYYYKSDVKLGYYIYLEAGNIEFYFIIPEEFKSLLISKIKDTWLGLTIEETATIPMFSDDAIKYAMNYSKKDIYSLNCDKRNNFLLSSICENVTLMSTEDQDKLGVFYNFLPSDNVRWRNDYDKILASLREGASSYKFSGNNFMFLTVSAIVNILDFGLSIITDFIGEERKQPKITNQMLELSSESLRKKEKSVVGTQIVVLAESSNKLKADNLAKSACESFKVLSSDNELVYNKLGRKPINLLDTKLKGVDTFRSSSQECQNFLSLPSTSLIEEYNIKSVETLETLVPAELQQGTICIGRSTYRGNNTKAYLTTDREYKNLALVIIGPSRSGKSNLIANIVNDATKNGEFTIVLDFCGECELSDTIKHYNPRTKIVDLERYDSIQGFGYNEVSINNTENTEEAIFERYKTAKMQTMQLMSLIDSIADESELSARMTRYLECAALAVFLQSGSIKRVFDCLSDAEVRDDVIKAVPKEQQSRMESYIKSLRELDDKKIGTKDTLISGILNRVSKLNRNAYMEMMLQKDCSNNFNLLEEMQRNQVICLKMPDSMFTTKEEKDTYCTYWMTKIWLALQLRKRDVPTEKQLQVNIVVDEIYQTPHCEDFVKQKLSQIAKFKGKMIMSCHYLNQMTKLRNELKSANSSFMLIAGCDKDNYNELKSELYPFEVEDLLSLKRYHSLNRIKTFDGYAKFITELPPKL